MRVSRILSVAAGILGMLLAGSGQAAIYKWVDAHGQVHFSDHPSGNNAQQLEIHNSASAEQQREAEHVTQTYQNLSQQYDQQEAAQKASAQAKARSKARRARICHALTAQANAADQHPIATFKQDGTPQYLTDEQTAAYRKRLHALEQANCSQD